MEVKSCVKKSLGVAKPCRKSGRRRSKTFARQSLGRVTGGRNLAMERVRHHHKVIQREVEVVSFEEISLFFTRKSRFFIGSSYAKGRLGGVFCAGA